MPDAPTHVSHNTTQAAGQPRAVESNRPSIQTQTFGAQASMKTVGVYERPRGVGKLSKPLKIALLAVLIIISVIISIRFLF